MKYLVRKTVIFEREVEAHSRQNALDVFELNYGEAYSRSYCKSQVAIKVKARPAS